ncbi:MAG: hypothetical protein ACKO96_15890, partial [Flammeovirgaceae bacterium]
MDTLKRRCEAIQHLLVALHSLLTFLQDFNQAWWYLTHNFLFAEDFLKLYYLACQYCIRIFHQAHKKLFCTFFHTSLLHYFVYQTLLDFLRQAVAFDYLLFADEVVCNYLLHMQEITFARIMRSHCTLFALLDFDFAQLV